MADNGKSTSSFSSRIVLDEAFFKSISGSSTCDDDFKQLNSMWKMQTDESVVRE